MVANGQMAEGAEPAASAEDYSKINAFFDL
jgi:hypothetical protein